MSFQSDDEQLGLVLGLVFAIVAVSVSLVLGVALQRAHPLPLLHPGAPVAPAAPAQLPVVLAPAPPAAPASAAGPSPAQVALMASDAASVTVEYGVVKFYFASGKAELAPGAGEALVDVVRAAKAGKKVVVAGFHDSRGNAAVNAELARKRALAVREALLAAGVEDSRISLQKPAQTAGSGSDADARRVEITLQ